MPFSVRTLSACALIVVTALALYWPATAAWFYQDDLQWLAGTLTFQPVHLLDFDSQNHFFRPVISLYFWGVTPWFDGSPVLFHWANHVLHAANGLLLFAVARAIGFSAFWSFGAAMFFVTMPAYVEAIAWVSALAEAVTTFFGLIATWALLHARRYGSGGATALSIAAFVLGLMTHESAVMLLPLLVIADWAFASPEREPIWRNASPRIRRFMPHAVLLAIYLFFDLMVNRRSYLVEEGHYRIGLHAVENILSYVIVLFVGERTLPTFVVVSAALGLLLVRGTPRVLFAAAWMLLSILPFAFFTWSNTSRYAYMPSVGMALLLTEGLSWLDGRLRHRVNPRAGVAISTALAAFVTIRFALFTVENLENFIERTEPYRQLAHEIRAGGAPPGGTIAVDADVADALQFRYVEALARWELKDPGLKVEVRP